MINFYSANTDLKGYKKPFNISWWIKIFTAHERPTGMKWKDVPTHVSIGEDVTVTGRRLIFESYVVQMLNPYDNPHIEFVFVKGQKQIHDPAIFWKIVDAEKMRGYAVFQLIDFIRLWFYNKVFKRDPKNVWFPKSSVCSEIGYSAAKIFATKYYIEKTLKRLIKHNSNHYHPMRLLNICIQADQDGEGIFIKWKK